MLIDGLFFDFEFDGLNIGQTAFMFESTGKGAFTIQNSVIRGTLKNWMGASPKFGFVASFCKTAVNIINSSFAGFFIDPSLGGAQTNGFICGQSTGSLSLGANVSIFSKGSLT